MANTFFKLDSVTVGAGGAASVTFSNIPRTYTDLVVKYSTRCSGSGQFQSVFLRMNGDSSAVYSGSRFWYYSGFASSYYTGSTSNNMNWTSGSTATANTFGTGEITIPNYISSSGKSFSSELMSESNSTTEVVTGIASGLYATTVPITSLTVIGETSFVQNSTFTLYGVFNADVSSAPSTPNIGTATASDASASVTFTGVANAASYTMTSSPGSITATGTTSPITVTGLTNGTAYTFTCVANNPFGSSASSAASNSVTPVAPPVPIPLLGAWTTAGTTTPGAAADAYYGVSLVSGEPRVFAFAGSRSNDSYYNNGAGGTWTASGAARPTGQGLGSSSKSMTNSGLFYTYGGDTGTQNLVYSTQTGSSWTSQNAVNYNAGWSDGCYFTQSGNHHLIAVADYSTGTPAGRATIASDGSLSWGGITSYPVYASAPRFARLTSVAIGMGGFTSTSLSATRADVYSYNSAGNSWTSQTSLPFTPNGGYIPAFSLTGNLDSRIYVSQASGTQLWSRGDSSGTWRNETAVPSAWSVGWGTVSSTGTLRVQVSSTTSTHFQTVA
jgi:hypothetical protein